jgi:site-specific recombinase
MGLSGILAQAGDKMEPQERMFWFEQLLLWLRKEDAAGAKVRRRLFFQMLQQNENWQKDIETATAALLNECRFLNFFTHTGYAPEYGLWADLSSRVFRKLVPAAGTGDIHEIILNVFRTEKNIEWLTELLDEDLLRLRSVFATSSLLVSWQKRRSELEAALIILSTHLAHHGLSLSIRSRLEPKRPVIEFPVIRLAAVVQGRDASSEQANRELRAAVPPCRQDVAAVYQSIELSGVSVDIVHKLEVISALLDQIELLIDLEEANTEIEGLRRVRDYVVAVARAGIRGRSVREHLNRHFYLLARKIAERNGHSGEHYISRTREESWALFRSAIFGGMVVVAMTITKTFVIRSEPAPMFLALEIWVVYATGFLTMQFRGYSLATKIPSFTASLLSRKLKEARNHQDSAELYHEIRHIFKSQLVGLTGNLVGVIPIALLIGFLSRILFHGHDLMSEHYAHHTLADLHPFKSLVVFLGALTGVVLWASSICGGWLENWIAFNGICETLEHHPVLRRLLGPAMIKRLTKGLENNASALGTNLSLGFFFGFVPFFGNSLGLNLDGRHVTISTAGATFALSALHYTVEPSVWIITVSGLALVGLMNFAVSFSLALVVATRSQKLKMPWVWRSLYRSWRARKL